MTGPVVDRIVSAEAFDALASEWDAFARGLGSEGFFARHAIVRANLGASMTGRRDRMLVLVVRERGEIIALAPLVIKPERTGLATLHWADSRTPLYTALAIRRKDEGRVFPLLAEAIRQVPQVRKLKADYVPESSALARFLEGMGGTAGDGMETFRVGLDGDPRSGLSGKRRSTLRSAERRLAGAGELSLGRLMAPGAVTETLNWILDRKAGQMDPGGTGQAWIARPATRRYFTALSDALAGEGQTGATELVVGAHRVAACFFFTDGRTAWASKFAYDPDWAAYSPGWLVMLGALDHLRAEGVETVDLMMGEGLLKRSLGVPTGAARPYRVPLNPVSAALRSLFRR